MAAPKEKTLKDLNGKWKMNKDLSDDVDGVLQIQGFNSLLRTAIAHAPVYLHISQTQDGSNTHYKIDLSTTASIPAVNEEWTTDWKFRESKDPVLGPVRAKARWSKSADVDNAGFLAGGWIDEGEEHVEAFIESAEDEWTARQIWGFEELSSQRMFVRRVIVKKDHSIQKVKLVYDFESS